jgi:hypothetical protein
MLLTIRDKDVEVVGFGPADLEPILDMAISLKQAYNFSLEVAEATAIETGELHLLKVLKKKVEDAENGGNA